jgi:hypothetical protein
MKASDILRNLADLLDQSGVSLPGQEQQQPQQAVSPQEIPTQDQTPKLVPVEVSNADGAEAGVFVPPLQAKIELLKKSVGVDNTYDEQGGDELATIKKLSGIPAQQEAADDEPLEV